MKQSKRKTRIPARTFVLTFGILIALVPLLCASNSNGTVYYVDAATGDDSNAGTFASPFKTYLPFVWTYSEPNPDIGKISLGPGDRVVFRKGVYSATFKTPDDAVSRGCFLRNVHGTSELPIVIEGEPGAILDAMPPEPGNEAPTLNVEQCSNIIIRNLEFTGLGRAIDIAENNNVAVRDCWLHDIDGTDNGNMEPIKVTNNAGRVEIYRCLLNDNFDRTNADTNGQSTENSRHIGCYSNQAHVYIHHNTVFNTDSIEAQYTGSGIVTKHAGSGVFEVSHNIIARCWSSSIGTGSPGSLIHTNLIIEGDEIRVKDFGGPSAFNDIEIKFNTMMRCNSGLAYRPNDRWYPRFGFSDIGPLRFSCNVVEDVSDHYFERGTLDLGPYVEPQIPGKMNQPGNLVFDNNSYDCPGSSFLANLYAGVSGFQESYNFVEWQALGFDLSSDEADPQLNGVGMPMAASAAGRGWFSGEPMRVSLFTVDSLSRIELAPEVDEGGLVTMMLVRSGDALDLSQPLIVELNSSIEDELDLPDSVTIPAGQDSIQFVVQANVDGESEGQQAVQVTPSIPGLSNGISAWVRINDSNTSINVELKKLLVGDNWQVVQFDRNYNEPVVIAGPPSENDLQPVTVRIRNVQPNSCEVSLESWDYLPGHPVLETVPLMVMESGGVSFPDGTAVVAGRSEVGTAWKRVDFPSSFANKPVFLAQVATNRDVKPVTLGVRSLQDSGVHVRVREEEAADQVHSVETVHWIAISTGGGNVDGRVFEAFRKARAISNLRNSRIEFSNTFPTVPIIFATPQSTREQDPFAIRQRFSTTGNSRVFLQEDRSDDLEIRHIAESVGYLAIEFDQ